jgi:hypothetical protein
MPTFKIVIACGRNDDMCGPPPLPDIPDEFEISYLAHEPEQLAPGEPDATDQALEFAYALMPWAVGATSLYCFAIIAYPTSPMFSVTTAPELDA